jgi:hypothetical protein
MDMKNYSFDKLLSDAQDITKSREELLGMLMDRMMSEILPRFCSVCASYDLNHVYFKSENKVFGVSKKQVAEDGYFYAFAINVKEQTLSDAIYDEVRKAYFVPDESVWVNFDEVEVYRRGLIDFLNSLKSRLASYNKRYNSENILADGYLLTI